ncbi:MAG: hypothetical protein IPG50_04380 [Myxococcales bacterium]|nr:hypothetical protein [Myxococcales bacterium]
MVEDALDGAAVAAGRTGRDPGLESGDGIAARCAARGIGFALSFMRSTDNCARVLPLASFAVRSSKDVSEYGESFVGVTPWQDQQRSASTV